MTFQRKTKAGADWHDCWHRVDAPAEGILTAMPLSCWAPGLRDASYILSGQPVRILWLSIRRNGGFAYGWSTWESDRGRPAVPANWMACHDRERQSRTSRFDPWHSSADPLAEGSLGQSWCVPPFPPWTGKGDGLSQNLALLHSAGFLSQFIGVMPGDVVMSLAAVKTAGVCVIGEGSIDFLGARPSRIDTELLRETLSWASFLGGADPCAEVDAATAARRRQQFVHAFPALVSVARGVVLQIDSGAEPLAAIATQHRLPLQIVSGIGSTRGEAAPCAARVPYNPGLREILNALPAPSHRTIPTISADGWRSLSAFNDAVGSVNGRRPRQRHIGSTLAPGPDGTYAWLDGRGSKLWPHLRDVVRDMQKELVGPAMKLARPSTQHEDYSDFLVDALLTLGYAKTIRALDIHMLGAVHGPVYGLRFNGSEKWGQAAPDATEPGGRTLRFLGTQAELDREAAALDHCVGGFGMRCRMRHCAILSIGLWERPRGRRGPVGAWVPTSTVELAPDGRDASNPQVIQHYGLSNSKPDERDSKALTWWREEVAKGAIRLAPGSLRSNIDGYDIAAELGDAWDTPEAHAYRWDRWRRILDVRARSFGDWLLTMPASYKPMWDGNARLAEIAVDADALMGLALEIRELETAASPSP